MHKDYMRTKVFINLLSVKTKCFKVATKSGQKPVETIIFFLGLHFDTLSQDESWNGINNISFS